MGWSARRQTCAARVFHPALGFVQVCPLSSLAFFSLHFAFDMLVSLCFFVAPSVSPPLSHILLACFALLRYFFFSSAVLLYLPAFFFYPSCSFSCGCSSFLKPQLHLSGSHSMFYAWSVSRTSPSTCFHLHTPTRALNHFSAHISLLLSSHLQLRLASLHSSPSPLCLCLSPCGTFLPCVFMSCKCPSFGPSRAGPGRESALGQRL